MKVDRSSFVPLYVQLKNILQRQILGGQLAPGSIIPSEFTLSRTCGVSRITVRQALADLESDGLIRREPGRGTFVTAAVPRNGLTIGLLFGGLSEHTFGRRSDAAFGDLVQGIAEVTSDFRASILALHVPNPDRFETMLASPAICQLNGLLVRITRQMTESHLQALDRTGIPYVIIKRRVLSGRAHCVISDEVAGACAAVEHVLQLGHRRIGMFIGPAEIGVWDERLKGYLQALERADIAFDPDLVLQGGYPMDDAGYQGTHTLLDRPDPPTAIFAGNDYMAHGAYRAIRERGLEPGRDVAVLGYGGTPFAVTMHPALTTVTTALHDFGTSAARLLLDAIMGSVQEPTQVLVPWRLDVRGSTLVRSPSLPSPTEVSSHRAHDEHERIGF